MGYVLKDIAVITEPKPVSLSGSPNFVQFASYIGLSAFLEVSIEINASASTLLPALSLLRFTDSSGVVHSYKGTRYPEQVGAGWFLMSKDTADTAQNLRQTLESDRWFDSLFEVTIPAVRTVDGGLRGGTTLNIKSRGVGSVFNMDIDTPDDPDHVLYTVTWEHRKSVNDDSISGNDMTAEIDLDVYTYPDVFLGQDDAPVSLSKIGTPLITLRKTYAGVPLWFELNSLFAHYDGYNLPPAAPGWFNTGTLRRYRFSAVLKGVNSVNFYWSNVLYVLNGRGAETAQPDLSEYIYGNGDTLVRLLTNKPRTPYVRGQREFLNFLFSDPERGTGDEADATLRVIYRAYTTGGKYIGAIYGSEITRGNLFMVNTCLLDIDSILDQFPRAGIVRVALAQGSAIASNALEYTVRPDCLHTLRQFSFINRLGGWDTFNFDAPLKDEIKPSVETYERTLTPAYRRGEGLEVVYDSTLANTFTVEGAPVTDEVAAWLKELASARVIIDGDGNSVVIEDFTLIVTASDSNMQKPTIKYRLSE